VFCTATPARGAPDRDSKALRPARTDAREHEQVAERVPVFAEAQMLASSTANPMEMRVSVPPPHLFSILLSRCCVWRSHAPLALRCLLFGRAVVVQAFSGFGGALRSFRLEPEAPACARACSCVL